MSLDVTIRLAGPLDGPVEREIADRLRETMTRKRETRAEFVARLSREVGTAVAFALPSDSLRRQEIA